MTEIIVAVISALSAVTVAYIMTLKDRRKDRELATEVTAAKNTELEVFREHATAEIEGLKARLGDCHNDRDWLRTQLAGETDG